MQKQNSSDLIKSRIFELKNRQKEELILLKNQLNASLEKLKPINLLKETVKDVRNSSDLKSNLLNNAIGISTGFLSKKLLIGNSSNPIKKIIGTFIEFAVANIAVKNSEKIIANGETLFQLIFGRKKNKKKYLLSSENERLIEN